MLLDPSLFVFFISSFEFSTNCSTNCRNNSLVRTFKASASAVHSRICLIASVLFSPVGKLIGGTAEIRVKSAHSVTPNQI